MKIFAFVNALLLYILFFVLLMSYYEEFVNARPPCSFCVMQRFFMVGIAVPLMFNVVGPISYKNTAASLLSCVLGSVVSLYQWSGLLINDGVSTSPKIFDFPLYIWSTFLFFAVALCLFAMLFFMKSSYPAHFNLFTKVGYCLFFIMMLFQIVTAFYSCGALMC